MVYIDASVVIALVVEERHSERAELWLGATVSALYVSGWVITECASALSVKERTGTLRQIDRPEKDNDLRLFFLSSTTEVDVTRDDFDYAARSAARADLNLRAGDALHLAVARRHDLELVTLDRRLADAGPLLGVRTRLL